MLFGASSESGNFQEQISKGKTASVHAWSTAVRYNIAINGVPQWKDLDDDFRNALSALGNTQLKDSQVDVFF